MKDGRAAAVVCPPRAEDSALGTTAPTRGGRHAVSRHRLGDAARRMVRAQRERRASPGDDLRRRDGLARVVARLGPDVRGCIEMMSGAVWVRERLAACGWTIELAEARKVKAIAPLACKTDRVDARVLAELARRDLVPGVWVPSLDDRAIRERLRRRTHLVRLRTSAVNRTFGLLTQWGLRRNLTALRKPGALEELAEHGVPEVWRRSLATLLAVIDDLDRRLAPLERELRPLAGSDERARLLMTIPGVAELLGLTLASEIGDISRFPSARKLVGYSGLTPRIKQSGQSERVGRLSKAGPHTLRWAAVEAAQQAWRPSNPWHPLYTDIKRRHGKANPAKAAVARKVLIAAWHVLARREPFKPSASRATDLVPASSSIRLAA